jgi:hypothetical protein
MVLVISIVDSTYGNFVVLAHPPENRYWIKNKINKLPSLPKFSHNLGLLCLETSANLAHRPILKWKMDFTTWISTKQRKITTTYTHIYEQNAGS